MATHRETSWRADRALYAMNTTAEAAFKISRALPRAYEDEQNHASRKKFSFHRAEKIDWKSPFY